MYNPALQKHLHDIHKSYILGYHDVINNMSIKVEHLMHNKHFWPTVIIIICFSLLVLGVIAAFF